MKKLYRVTIMNTKNEHVALQGSAPDMAAAIKKVQEMAGVPETTEPTSVAATGQLDFEA